jgi:hypothetical protein
MTMPTFASDEIPARLESPEAIGVILSRLLQQRGIESEMETTAAEPFTTIAVVEAQRSRGHWDCSKYRLSARTRCT